MVGNPSVILKFPSRLSVFESLYASSDRRAFSRQPMQQNQSGAPYFCVDTKLQN